MSITKESINQFFVNVIAEEMKLDPSEIDIHAEFYNHGLDSISAIYILDKVEDFTKTTINPIDFWDYPTIDKLSAYLLTKIKP